MATTADRLHGERRIQTARHLAVELAAGASTLEELLKGAAVSEHAQRAVEELERIGAELGNGQHR
jgi:hypothetical protein